MKRTKNTSRLVLGGVCLGALSLFSLLVPVCRAQSETDFYDQAVGLAGEHKYAEAEAAFRKSIHADPRYKEAWEGLASVLKAEGKDASLVAKMAEAAPAARAGQAPALTDEQKRALGEGGAQATADAAKQQQIAALKAQLAELEKSEHPPAAEAHPPAPPAAPSAPAVKVRAITESPLVQKTDAGELAVMEKSGKPIDGLAISKYNSDIFSPSIAVGGDGTIHAAFCERQAVNPFAYFVYYRASRDGGVTWSEAKNLSEGLPDTGISRCQVLVDSRNRAYVIWRSDFAPGTMAQTVQEYYVAGNRYNLVYRALEGGAWSKLTFISHPTSPDKQDDGMATWCAGVDPKGRVQAAWNALQFPYHAEWFNGRPTYDGRSLVFAATLDGATPTKAREAYHSLVKTVTYNAAFQKTDDFDVINGYFDAAGDPHFITAVMDMEIRKEGTSLALVEAGRQVPAVDLPGAESQVWMSRPRLMLDAKGRQHVIAFYKGGEAPAVKDFLIGHPDDPTVIRAAKNGTGTIEGFQAFAAAGGEMIVIMQTNDTGNRGEAESFVSMSNGGGWSTPVCVTNNKARQKFQSVNTSARSNVAQQTRYYPGEGAAAIDPSGHVMMLLIDKEVTMTASNAFGVNLAGGDTAKPVLRFMKF